MDGKAWNLRVSYFLGLVKEVRPVQAVFECLDQGGLLPHG